MYRMGLCPVCSYRELKVAVLIEGTEKGPEHAYTSLTAIKKCFI